MRNTIFIRQSSFIHHNFTQSILFTRIELEKLHINFVHPPTQRLLQTLRRADPGIYPYVKETMDQIVEAREICTELDSPRFSFRASLPPEDNIFNDELSVDLEWFNGKAVLHVV